MGKAVAAYLNYPAACDLDGAASAHDVGGYTSSSAWLADKT